MTQMIQLRLVAKHTQIATLQQLSNITDIGIIGQFEQRMKDTIIILVMGSCMCVGLAAFILFQAFIETIVFKMFKYRAALHELVGALSRFIYNCYLNYKIFHLNV